jgi:carbon storage regulator CsrA
MLVITRRPSDKIIFPKLGITIHVVRVEGRSVRMGIEAPRNVHVLRHELAEQQQAIAPVVVQEPEAMTGLSHAVRNRLNAAVLRLQLIQRKIQLGEFEPEAWEATLNEVIRKLETLDSEINNVSANREPQYPAAPKASDMPPVVMHESRSRRPLSKRKVLVVEDNLNECELLAGFLRTCNYEVATAYDGADALSWLANHDRPDAVLLDINMPRVGGAAAIREIRNNPALSGMKLFAVSGVLQAQTKITTGPDGVDCWFTKPIRPDRLVAQIDREFAPAPAQI